MKTLIAIAMLPLSLCVAAYAQSERAVPATGEAHALGVHLVMTRLCTTCDMQYAQADQAAPSPQASTSLGLRQLLQMPAWEITGQRAESGNASNFP